MKNLIKFLLLSVVGLLSVAVIAIFVLLVAVDPNRYKPALESLFARQTGLQMTIAGDIDWSFRPVFGFNLNDVRITNGITPRELASFSSASLKVAPASLFGSTLEIEELVASDLHINWIVDAQGVNNWFPQGMDRPQPTGAQTDSGDGGIAAEIQRISLRNARLAVQDAQRGINTSLENLSIESEGTNFEDRPFPVRIGFRLIDVNANRNLRVNFSSTAAIDYAAGNATLSNLRLDMSPLDLRGEVAITDFHNSLGFSGELNSNTFNLPHLMENLMGPGADMQPSLPGSFDNNADQVRFQVNFRGDETGISIPSLDIALDKLQARLDVEYRYAANGRPDTLIYQLSTGAVNLDEILGTGDVLTDIGTEGEPAAVPAGTSVASGPAEDTPIPVELLNSMNVIGNHSIEALTVAGMTMNNVNLALNLDGGVLQFETAQPVDFYQGRLAAVLRLDSTASTPTMNSTLWLESVDLAELTQSAQVARFVRGVLNAQAEHSLAGSTVNQMIASINGVTAFNVTENAVDIGLIKQVFGSISALSPSGEIGRNWPDTLSFEQFDGSLVFSDGFDADQVLQMRMDNFHVSGTGGVDLGAGSFDYAMEFVLLGEPAVQTIPVNENYQGVVWPVQCAASFSAEPRQYCSPNFQMVREVFAQLARNQVERRVQEALTDRIPEEYQEAARGLLRNLRLR